MRNFALASVILACFAATAIASAQSDDAQTLPTGFVSPVQDASVRLAVTPTYPKRALRHGIDGEVTVEFTISRYGRAKDLKIVAAKPRKVFEKEVLDAMQYWIFEPARPISCGTVEQPARQTIRFAHGAAKPVQVLPIFIADQPTLPREQRQATLAEVRAIEAARRNLSHTVNPRGLVPIQRVDPEYPEDALERRLEGMVAVSFVIEQDGSITEPVVVDAVRGSLFQGAALRAIRNWEFQPAHNEDGQPIERTGCHEFIFLADEYLRKQKELAKREKNIQVFEPK